jgi:uncharacterized membrane protein YfcA
MPHWLLFVLVGLAVGSVGGMLGIGGGVLVIPALVFLFAFPQKLAVGTSLAMLLPPIGIFALMPYWRDGNVNIRAAMLLAAGFAVGGYFGGWFANRHFVSDRFLRVLFAFFMLYVAGNMLFRSEDRVRAGLKTVVIMVGFAIMYLGARMLGRRLETKLNLPEVYRSKLGAPLTPDYEI